MFFETNAAELAKYQPALAEEIRKLRPSKEIELLPIVDEVPTMDAVIVVGLPAKDSWTRLMASRSAFILVAHNNLAELRSYLTILDLREPLSKGVLSFAVGEDGILQVLNDLFGTLYRRKATIFGQQGTSDYDSAIKELKFFDTLCASNRATMEQFAEDWQINISRNLKDFLGGPFLHDLAGVWNGGEAVVVAAGPSLDDVDLPGAFGGAPVLVCDTAAPVLAERGVTPDLIVTLDASESNKAYLRNLPAEVYENTILCVTPLVERMVYAPFKRAAFYSYGHPTLDHFRESGALFEPLATGGSVALTAVDIARLLGAKKIYLLGFDFQYYAFRTHARGTGAALRGMRAANRFFSVEQAVFEYQSEMETRIPAGIDRGGALTDRKFQKWKDWLELYAKNNDVELIQMSDRAAEISGVRHGIPSGGMKQIPLDVRRRAMRPEIRRELKFLAKEIELALDSPPDELLRRIVALPRVSRCLGYVIAWLSDKPHALAAEKLRSILRHFHEGVSAAATLQGL